MAVSRGIRLRGPVRDRLARRTDRSGRCWLWTGRLNRDGYAAIKIGGRYHMAHRVAYEEYVGAIPAGMQLDHLCRVRHCVNPMHLEPVTPRQNTMRGQTPARINAEKTSCANGHAFDAANTYKLRGVRHCRACNRANVRAYARRKRSGKGQPS